MISYTQALKQGLVNTYSMLELPKYKTEFKPIFQFHYNYEINRTRIVEKEERKEKKEKEEEREEKKEKEEEREEKVRSRKNTELSHIIDIFLEQKEKEKKGMK